MRSAMGYRVMRVRTLAVFLGIGLLLKAYDAELLKHPLQSRLAKYEFWEIVTGSHVWVILTVTYVLAVIISVRNCGRVRDARLSRHDSKIQGEAAAASILSFLFVPAPAMVAVRSLMVRSGFQSVILFASFSVILTFVTCLVITAVIIAGALLREARREGQPRPVTVNAKYEFTKEWSQVLTRFGSASDRLRAATYELVRIADPDPSIDRLSPTERTALLIEETKKALRGTPHVDEANRSEVRALRRQIESEVSATLERIAKWREEVRTLEGEGDNKLPPGIAEALPVPISVQEKLSIKNARIARIKYV
jgi:hypothetical protein